jgi:hypothetical protein
MMLEEKDSPYSIRYTGEGWEIWERSVSWDVKYASYDEAYDVLRTIVKLCGELPPEQQ